MHASKVESLLQFWRSRFLKEADFSNSEFKDIVDFRKCIFEDHLNFENTVFGEVDFSESLFKGSAHYIESKFNKVSYFNYIKFNKPEDIIFQRVDLSNVSFVNTDMSRINFMEGLRFGLKNEFEILDERRLVHPEQFEDANKRIKINVGNVLAVYRGLRKNYESKLRQDEARNFLNREKELQRKLDKNILSGNGTEYFSLVLEKLIKTSESNELEFKPRLVLEDKTKPINRIKVEVLQNVASFMNMDNGGILVCKRNLWQ
jgi:pentapeptide repeat protein